MKVKICFVGDFRVGKTSLIRKFVLDEFDDRYLETIGAKVTKKSVIVDHPSKDRGYCVDMLIWDIMGRKGFGDLLREAYFYGARGIVAVCDLTRPETVEGLRDWIDSVVRVTGDVPIYVLANKADLEQNVDEETIAHFAESYDSPYLLTSAKTGMNVERAFADMALRTSTLDLSGPEAKERERVSVQAD
ncbi:MAG: Rab family GTPase [Thermoplasmata archaeon]